MHTPPRPANLVPHQHEGGSMTRTITPQEIKHGDRIRVFTEFTVGKATDASSAEILDPLDGDGEVWNREAEDYVYVQDDSYTIELVKRELPPLPTTAGSVVKVFDADLNKSARWMLHTSGVWNSQTGGAQDKDLFADFISNSGFEFEVIA
ncbi:hypothetical protein SEA_PHILLYPHILLY_9 [Microbacterium phage PhillyPhilly]|nr:hypothetical protein SEA_PHILLYPHILLY_9 [Microbacterium phage PhillyPhilly]